MPIFRTACAILIASFVHLEALQPKCSADVYPPELYVGGFLLGPQAFSFNRFTLVEAIDKAKEAGCSVIEIFSGQPFSPENDAPFDHNADLSLLAQAKIKLERSGVRIANYGIIGLIEYVEQDPHYDEYSNVFDFAKLMGIPIITAEPTLEAMDLLEKLVQEYDIKLAIHNHSRRPDNPEYTLWDPEYVLEMLEGRDPRIGVCGDVGNWVRSDIDPLEAIRLLEGRLIGMHMKDLNEFGSEAYLDGRVHDVMWGEGVCDIEEILIELRRQRFSGTLTIEYIHNMDDNVGDIAQCVHFVREFGRKHDAVH